MSPGLFTNVIMAIFLRRVCSRCQGPSCPRHVVDQVTVQVYRCTVQVYSTGVQVYSTGVQSKTVFRLWIKSQKKCTGVQYRCTVGQVTVQVYRTCYYCTVQVYRGSSHSTGVQNMLLLYSTAVQSQTVSVLVIKSQYRFTEHVIPVQ